MNIIGIIPARLKSSRLPEKMLRKVNGKTLIELVYENAKKAKLLKKLYVATDSPKIKKAVEKSGGLVIMTSSKCKSGTERIKEALKTVKANINDIVVNIQGDEPALEPKLIDAAVDALVKDDRYDCATLASQITGPSQIKDASCVKVVTDKDGGAMYFSRAVIPFSRDKKTVPVLKHIGLYAYRKTVLDRWNSMQSCYENTEKLEQLRMLENGIKIKVIRAKSRSIGIDTPKDLKNFKKMVNGDKNVKIYIRNRRRGIVAGKRNSGVVNRRPA
ncbi:MAG TPA: 3-deoxy-manno-octulosonate cytidylyltransferase [Candidatus Goldiibacteriota bacterium]|nr:3-deoxy-manno-octulosonate cytidylyltransferase [Candidatus Goldiibacteriota bacterium]